MKNSKAWVGFTLLVLAVTCLALGEDKKSEQGSVSGAWDCVAHLTGQDDIPFTMNLEQKDETVTGSIATSQGDLEIKSGTFKNNALELHLETAEAKYVVSGKLEGGQFKGQWSKDPDGLGGDWEGKKSVAKSSGQ